MFAMSPIVAENFCQVDSSPPISHFVILYNIPALQELKNVPKLDVVQVGITTELPNSLIDAIQTHGKGNKKLLVLAL